MREPGELKVTLICATCENQYGKWRRHCPACGTMTPTSQYETSTPTQSVSTPRVPRIRKRRDRRPDECIVCRRGGAKQLRCPHCEEPIHRNCLMLHGETCQEFQVTLQEAHRRIAAEEEGRNGPVEMSVRSGEPSPADPNEAPALRKVQARVHHQGPDANPRRGAASRQLR